MSAGMYGGQKVTALKPVAVKVFCEGRITGDFRSDRVDMLLSCTM